MCAIDSESIFLMEGLHSFYNKESNNSQAKFLSQNWLKFTVSEGILQYSCSCTFSHDLSALILFCSYVAL
jgi:hypothetical protein